MIEPFIYQKTTAFKERVQIISKVNEIIESVNNSMTEEGIRQLIDSKLLNYYTKEEVDDALENIDLSSYYTKTETDNIVTNINSDISEVNTIAEQNQSDIVTINGNIDNIETELDTKQTKLIATSPITIDENTNEIGIDTSSFYDNTKLIINGQQLGYRFGVVVNASYPLYFGTSKIGSATNQNIIQIESGANIGFKYGNGSNNYPEYNGIIASSKINSGTYNKNCRSIALGTSTKDNYNISSDRLYMTHAGVGSGYTPTTWGLIDNDNHHGILLKPNGTKYTFIGKSHLISNSEFYFDSGLLIDSSIPEIYFASNNTLKPILTLGVMPSGKVITDTVTFQDLIEMGLIRS